MSFRLLLVGVFPSMTSSTLLDLRLSCYCSRACRSLLFLMKLPCIPLRCALHAYSEALAFVLIFPLGDSYYWKHIRFFFLMECVLDSIFRASVWHLGESRSRNPPGIALAASNNSEVRFLLATWEQTIGGSAHREQRCLHCHCDPSPLIGKEPYLSCRRPGLQCSAEPTFLSVRAISCSSVRLRPRATTNTRFYIRPSIGAQSLRMGWLLLTPRRHRSSHTLPRIMFWPLASVKSSLVLR